MLFSSFTLECIRSASIYLGLIHCLSQKQITFPLNLLWPDSESDNMSVEKREWMQSSLLCLCVVCLREVMTAVC